MCYDSACIEHVIQILILGVFKVAQFHDVIQIGPRLTPVAMVTKLSHVAMKVWRL